jgi:pre-mRNA-splicing factor CWC26
MAQLIRPIHFLNTRYMSGAKADAILSRTQDGQPKKKKRKANKVVAVAVGEGAGLLIADEDSAATIWDEVEEEEADVPGE